MLQELVEYLKKQFIAQPLTQAIGERSYKVVPEEYGLRLGDLITSPEAPVLNLRTLNGFVDAYKAKIDEFPGTVAVHVVDHVTVQLVSMRADEYGRRHRWLQADCREINPFPFDEYVAPERFLLALKSGFLPTEDVVSLQKLASSLTSENSVGTADDGLSQVVTIKQGTVTRNAVTIPQRINLYAYRTFREVDPVGSEFQVRLKGQPGSLPSIALLQIDADKWKTDTMLVVRKWLAERLPEATIIA